MVSLLDRAKAAVHTFRHGLSSSQTWGKKDLPFAWPDFKKERPEWHLVDYNAYIREGYSLNSLVYSAVMYKVRATVTAPLRGYSGTEDDPQLLPRDDPYQARLVQPNPYQSWVEFHSRNVVFLNISGNVYIYIDPDSGEMYSFRPDRVYIVPDSDSHAGLKGFIYVPEGKSHLDLENVLPILPEDMLHIKLPNPLDELEGLGYGMSPLQPAAQVVDVDNLVTKFLNIFFNKGAMVTGILKFDVPLKDNVVDKILDRWKEKYGGIFNWQVGVLDRGGTYERVALTFEEMGFDDVDTRSETRILGPFGIAPILIGARAGLASSTYSNYEAARQAVWEDTLIPEQTLFETEYKNRLDESDKFVMMDYSRVPALQRALSRQINAAYTLVQMRVPPNQALRGVGLRIGNVPGGDEPIELSGPGAQQGPRTDPERESWGMREDVPGQREVEPE
ncbi:MAG: phage portal protein [Acholeplasmataceae bacterium]